jgi:hypothetical protein
MYEHNNLNIWYVRWGVVTCHVVLCVFVVLALYQIPIREACEILYCPGEIVACACLAVLSRCQSCHVLLWGPVSCLERMIEKQRKHRNWKGNFVEKIDEKMNEVIADSKIPPKILWKSFDPKEPKTIGIQLRNKGVWNAGTVTYE